ncbi:hypothetical protein EMCRGX_G012963 [Ephydatia muelleri]
MSRPLVIPEPFTGEGSWDHWIFLFENIAEVNKWDAAGKLQWLKVRLAGRAQAALQRFSAEDADDYGRVKKRLQERFEPSCRKERYKAELQTARRKKDEGWADLADRLRQLAQKGYPDLEEKAKEQLALNVFLSLIDNHQVAFSVKQKRPASLDEAVSATLEIECYANVEARTIGVVDEEERVVAEVGTKKEETHGMRDAIAQLTERMKTLEEQLKTARFDNTKSQATFMLNSRLNLALVRANAKELLCLAYGNGSNLIQAP